MTSFYSFLTSIFKTCEKHQRIFWIKSSLGSVAITVCNQKNVSKKYKNKKTTDRENKQSRTVKALSNFLQPLQENLTKKLCHRNIPTPEYDLEFQGAIQNLQKRALFVKFYQETP